jgi:two-component system, cell cycle sensor histidine kinase and response regulator CckA
MKHQANAEIGLEILTPSDRLVVIRVSDSGPGVPIELRQKIFEPFFTTKEVGKGTGLGLALSASLASQLRGHLALVTDSDAKGATFEITIPRHIPGETEELVPNNLKGKMAKPNRVATSCLLIDDDALVRETIKEVLTDFVSGPIEEAASSQEAVDILLSERGKGIGIIFTDLSMGAASGESLIEHIRKVYGNKHRLFVITGSIAPMKGELKSKIDGLINKPFLDTDLAAAVFKGAS